MNEIKLSELPVKLKKEYADFMAKKERRRIRLLQYLLQHPEEWEQKKETLDHLHQKFVGIARKVQYSNRGRKKWELYFAEERRIEDFLKGFPEGVYLRVTERKLD